MESACSCTNEGTSISTVRGEISVLLVSALEPSDRVLRCTRKGKDYTYLYGKHVGTGSLTPFIAKAFDSRVDEYASTLSLYTQDCNYDFAG